MKQALQKKFFDDPYSYRGTGKLAQLYERECLLVVNRGR